MKKTQVNHETRITRRSVLCGAVTTAAVLMTSRLWAEEMQKYLPPRMQPKPKGPLVFLDYDKEEIDLAYDQAPWAPNAREVSKRNAQKSATAIARLGEPQRVSYGSADIEGRDLCNQAGQRADQCFFPRRCLAEWQCKKCSIHV